MFDFIKKSISTLYNQFSHTLSSFFRRSIVDHATLTELETILLQSDVGPATTQRIMEQLRARTCSDGAALHKAMKEILCALLDYPVPSVDQSPAIFLMVGINGSGKTTASAKLAAQWKEKGKKVLMVGADTFRAAAIAQLKEWAERLSIDLFTHDESKDPSAVIFQGCEQFIQGRYDILIIDTAGRLQTKSHLMAELAKIRRVIDKKITNTPIYTLLTIDSMLGQNSVEQARLFKDATGVSGIILTKMDSSAKGGIIFAIASECVLPIVYVTFGEKSTDIARFDPKTYVDDLLQKV